MLFINFSTKNYFGF